MPSLEELREKDYSSYSQAKTTATGPSQAPLAIPAPNQTVDAKGPPLASLTVPQRTQIPEQYVAVERSHGTRPPEFITCSPNGPIDA
jgi:hypothetical protein